MNPFAVFDPEFVNSETFTLVIIPLLIFLARVTDVSIGTMRIIFVSRGQRLIAPVLGFFEVLIWLLAIRQIMQNLNNPATYIAYAAGFATGNYFGMYLEERLAIGMLVIRLITTKDTHELVEHLHAAGYGVTSVDAEGATGRVKLIYTIIKRKNFPNVMDIISQSHPQAFVSVEEIQSASQGIFPPERNRRSVLGLFNLQQKRK